MGGDLGLLNLLAHENFSVERVVGEEQYAPDTSLSQLAAKTVTLSLEKYLPLMSGPSPVLYDFKGKRQKQRCCGTKEKAEDLNITSNGKIKFS